MEFGPVLRTITQVSFSRVLSVTQKALERGSFGSNIAASKINPEPLSNTYLILQTSPNYEERPIKGGSNFPLLLSKLTRDSVPRRFDNEHLHPRVWRLDR